jgi:Rrf2 family protein
MNLKSQVEWALHCCAILAGLPEGRHLAAKDLAELHGLPKEYLSKAMQSLSQSGLVSTTLGPQGGYRLARAAEKISFLDIVEAVEGRRNTFACQEIRKNNPSRPAKLRETKPCAIARVMWEADEAWRDRLRRVSLAELVETVGREVPKAVLEKTAEWIAARS